MFQQLLHTIGFILFWTTGSLAQPKRPNILFIPIDDLRPELSCYGNKIAITPTI